MEMISDVLNIFLTGLVGFLTWSLQRSIQNKDDIKETVKIILRAELKMYHSKCVKQGYISSDDYEYISEVFKMYKKFNGNGLGDKMWADIQKIEMRVDDESHSTIDN